MTSCHSKHWQNHLIQFSPLLCWTTCRIDLFALSLTRNFKFLPTTKLQCATVSKIFLLIFIISVVILQLVPSRPKYLQKFIVFFCICDGFNPNFPWGGRGPYYHPLSEIHDFSGTEPPLDCWKKNRAFYLSWFNRGGPTKFENTFFQIAKLRFWWFSPKFRSNNVVFSQNPDT